jgi:hypothetical protein
MRHRKYGSELVMFDFDAVWFSVNDEPVAYLETKYGGTDIDLNDREFRCLRNAVLPGKPFFCLWYYTYTNGIRFDAMDNRTKDCDYAQYYIVGANEEGKKFFPTVTALTEFQMVEFEYKLRGYTPAFAAGMAKGFATTPTYDHPPPKVLAAPEKP